MVLLSVVVNQDARAVAGLWPQGRHGFSGGCVSVGPARVNQVDLSSVPAAGGKDQVVGQSVGL